MEGQISRVKNLNHTELFFKERNYDQEKSDCMCLVLNNHLAFLNVHRELKELQVIVNMSANVFKAILPEVPLLSFRRPKNLRDEFVRAKLKPAEEVSKENIYLRHKK